MRKRIKKFSLVKRLQPSSSSSSSSSSSRTTRRNSFVVHLCQNKISNKRLSSRFSFSLFSLFFLALLFWRLLVRPEDHTSRLSFFRPQRTIHASRLLWNKKLNRFKFIPARGCVNWFRARTRRQKDTDRVSGGFARSTSSHATTTLYVLYTEHRKHTQKRKRDPFFFFVLSPIGSVFNYELRQRHHSSNSCQRRRSRGKRRQHRRHGVALDGTSA